MNYKGYIFDLDGTLLDSLHDIKESINRTLVKEDLPTLSKAQVRALINNGFDTFTYNAFQQAHEACGRVFVDERLAEWVAAYKQDYKANCTVYSRLYDHCTELFQLLADKNARIGICTNKAESTTRDILAHYQLMPFIEVIHGGDSEFGLKPDPGGIWYCIESICLQRDEVLFIGDSMVDANAAKNAGVDFALLTYGYRRETLDYFSPTYQFDCLSEMCASIAQG